MKIEEIRIDLENDAARRDSVSGLLVRPRNLRALLVLAHGAGAGMRHPFMERVAAELADHEVATLRYQFPYMEAGKKRPDRPKVALPAVRAAVAAGVERADGLPVYAGGKSFGGRMTSQAAAEISLPGVRGLVFLGFPLHPAGKPGTERAEHLHDVDVPMLFVQGTRDALARLELLEPVLDELNERSGQAPPARLHVVEGGDHSFKVLKRSGRTEAEVMAEIGDAVDAFVRQL